MANYQGQRRASIEEFLAAIIWDNVNVAFQALVLGFGAWLDEQEHSLRLDKSERIRQFEQQVDTTLRDGNIARLVYPHSENLPDWSHARVQAVSQIFLTALRQQPLSLAPGFLGELIGAWILSCPAELIRQDAALVGEKLSEIATNDDLLFLMRKWLSRSLEVGN